MVDTHTETTELYFLNDSSHKAYGAVVYLSSKLNNVLKVSFVLGKWRLAPINEKSLTITKLELLVAFIKARKKRKASQRSKCSSQEIMFSLWLKDSSQIYNEWKQWFFNLCNALHQWNSI